MAHREDKVRLAIVPKEEEPLGYSPDPRAFEADRLHVILLRRIKALFGLRTYTG